MNYDLAYKLLLDAYKNLDGWCSEEKSKYLFDLTFNTKPNLIVEIGVYKGKSLSSFSAASLLLDDCKVIGIDSYDINDIILNQEIKKTFVTQEELTESKNIMLDTFNNLKLPVNLIEKSSINAYFDENFNNKKIDILHIDSSHTEEDSVIDTLLWMPRIRAGGFLIYDDANWESLKNAQKFALKKCKHITYLEDGKTRIFQKL